VSSFSDYTTKMDLALNVVSITALLDLYNESPALFAGQAIPQDCIVAKTINYYQSAPINFSLEYPLWRVSINCRAETEYESYAIADAVINQINRVGGTDYFITCSLLQTIPPADDTDNFNTPIECIVKNR
jgi:hypothetical protein